MAPSTAPAAHHAGTRFRNPWPSGRKRGVLSLLRWLIVERLILRRRPPATTTTGSVPATPAFAAPRAPVEALTLTWVGHSTFLIQLAGLNILTDPMWGDRASPLSFAGPPRLTMPGVPIDRLPPLDLVLVSHDHYDHLDKEAVERLAARDPGTEWLAPLRVGRWLRDRGVRAVRELDWGGRASIGALELTCVPAQHFSGRTLGGRDATLWCGWVARTSARRGAVYFVGDTGLHPDFEALGSALGPFDAVLMPVGGYDPRWFMQPVHVSPDEAVTAFRALAAAHPAHVPPPLMGCMHFGTFRLSDEPIDEPPRRTAAAWREASLPAEALWIPRPGETRTVLP